MLLIQQLLPAAALAAAVAAALSGFARRAREPRARRALAAAILGTSAFAGYLLIAGWPPFPPSDTVHWLPWFGVAAAASAILSLPIRSRAASFTVFGLLCVAAMRLLLAPSFRAGGSAAEAWLGVGALGLAALLLGTLLSRSQRSSAHPLETSAGEILVSMGAAVALTVSGSLLLGQMALTLAAATAGGLVLSGRDRAAVSGAAPVFSLLLIALLGSGYFFTDLPGLSAVLLSAAPAAAILPCGGLAPRRAGAIRISAALALVGMALPGVFHTSPPWR